MREPQPARPPALPVPGEHPNGRVLSADDVAFVEAVAQRVAELLREPVAAPSGLVDARTLAQALGVSRSYVYGNAAALGAVRVGDGPRARLRFDVAEARARLDARRAGEGPLTPEPAPTRELRAPTRRRRARRAGTGGHSRPGEGANRADE